MNTIKQTEWINLNTSIEECQFACQVIDECVGFVVTIGGYCNMKRKMTNSAEVINQKAISGPKYCPVHGNWSEFGLWMPCSKNCGNGTARRFRFCNNPEPAHGGDNCNGTNFEDKDCYSDCSEGIK